MSAFPNHAEFLEILAHFKGVAECSLKDRRGCRWANLLTVATADAAEHCDACEGFYRGETRITPIELIAHELQKGNGLLRYWSDIRDGAEKIQQPSKNEIDGLGCAILTLGEFLNDIGRALPEYRVTLDSMPLLDALREFAKDASAAKRAAIKSAIDDYLWTLAEAAYHLSFAEYRIWFEHREWEVSGYKDDPDGPIDVRGIFDNIYSELRLYDGAHPHAFGLMRTALAGLSELRDNLPVAFVRGDPASDRVYLFTGAVKAALVLPTRIFFGNPVEAERGSDDPVSNCETSPFLARARIDFLNGLNTLLQGRAKAAKDATLRRKWYEAAAELMVQFSWGQPVFTPKQADRLIALANAAQREAWIQRRMKSPDETEKLPAEPPPPKEPPKVEARLDEETKRLLHEYITAVHAAKENPTPGRAGRKKSADTKPNPRKGSGLHGTGTKKMADQLDDFKEYLLNHPITPKCTIGYRAQIWWEQNKTDCEAAAKATGEARGYATHGKLASAYRSWKTAQEKKKKAQMKTSAKGKTKPKKTRETSRN